MCCLFEELESVLADRAQADDWQRIGDVAMRVVMRMGTSDFVPQNYDGGKR
jgi:hypothetical protein